MKKSIVLLALFVAGAVSQAFATSTTGLADWCINLNGNINTACNGAGNGGSNPGGGSINLGGWDSTLETGTNGLGSVVITLVSGENNQFASFYADYDLDFPTLGSFDDFGSINGVFPAFDGYELADPNTSNIFNDFSSDALTDTNTVGAGVASGPPQECCDVSFALSLGAINVPVGDTGTLTFTVSNTAPASGFYVKQTSNTDGDSIYLSSVVNITGPSGPTVPEPSTFALGLGVLVAAAVMARRKRVNV